MIKRFHGTHADAASVAEATVSVWQQVEGRLVSIIGQEGFRALYRRSLHLTSAAFPWLTTPQRTPLDSPLADLKLRLDGETPARAAEASRALLATFTRSLTDLIGEALTQHILKPVSRAGGSDDSTQEVSQ
jgi:hypothetical protein